MPDMAEAMEAVRLVADDLDNAWHATLLPLPAAIHVEGLAGSVDSAKRKLKAIADKYDPDNAEDPPIAEAAGQHHEQDTRQHWMQDAEKWRDLTPEQREQIKSNYINRHEATAHGHGKTLLERDGLRYQHLRESDDFLIFMRPDDNPIETPEELDDAVNAAIRRAAQTEVMNDGRVQTTAHDAAAEPERGNAGVGDHSFVGGDSAVVAMVTEWRHAQVCDQANIPTGTAPQDMPACTCGLNKWLAETKDQPLGDVWKWVVSARADRAAAVSQWKAERELRIKAERALTEWVAASRATREHSLQLAQFTHRVGCHKGWMGNPDGAYRDCSCGADARTERLRAAEAALSAVSPQTKE